VAEDLMAQNKISGPIYSALTSRRDPPPIVGIEDPAHYETNIQAFRDASPRIKGITSVLRRERAELAAQKNRTFAPALFRLDASLQEFHDGKSSLKHYVSLLRPFAQGRAHPHLLRFAEALRLESTLDFSRVERDRRLLAGRLARALSPGDQRDLTAWSASCQAGRMGFGAFYSRLNALCRQRGLDLAGFPAMEVYIRYALLADGVDAEAMWEELNALEKQALSALVRTGEEKDLLHKDRRLRLSQKLADFSLTPKEWEEYKAGAGGLVPGSFERFYGEASARDHSISGNLIDRMKNAGANPSPVILVTGGWHAPGLTRRLTQAGCAVISVVPTLTKIDSPQGVQYLSVFNREKTPLPKLFEGRNHLLATDPLSGKVRNMDLAGGLALTQSDPEKSYRKVVPTAKTEIQVKEGKLMLLFRNGAEGEITYHPGAVVGERIQTKEFNPPPASPKTVSLKSLFSSVSSGWISWLAARRNLVLPRWNNQGWVIGAPAFAAGILGLQIMGVPTDDLLSFQLLGNVFLCPGALVLAMLDDTGARGGNDWSGSEMAPEDTRVNWDPSETPPKNIKGDVGRSYLAKALLDPKSVESFNRALWPGWVSRDFNGDFDQNKPGTYTLSTGFMKPLSELPLKFIKVPRRRIIQVFPDPILGPVVFFVGGDGATVFSIPDLYDPSGVNGEYMPATRLGDGPNMRALWSGPDITRARICSLIAKAFHNGSQNEWGRLNLYFESLPSRHLVAFPDRSEGRRGGEYWKVGLKVGTADLDFSGVPGRLMTPTLTPQRDGSLFVTWTSPEGVSATHRISPDLSVEKVADQWADSSAQLKAAQDWLGRLCFTWGPKWYHLKEKASEALAKFMKVKVRLPAVEKRDLSFKHTGSRWRGRLSEVKGGPYLMHVEESLVTDHPLLFLVEEKTGKTIVFRVPLKEPPNGIDIPKVTTERNLEDARFESNRQELIRSLQLVLGVEDNHLPLVEDFNLRAGHAKIKASASGHISLKSLGTRIQHLHPNETGVLALERKEGQTVLSFTGDMKSYRGIVFSLGKGTPSAKSITLRGKKPANQGAVLRKPGEDVPSNARTLPSLGGDEGENLVRRIDEADGHAWYDNQSRLVVRMQRKQGTATLWTRNRKPLPDDLRKFWNNFSNGSTAQTFKSIADTAGSTQKFILDGPDGIEDLSTMLSRVDRGT
jgi:hypothetical protein